MTDRKIVSIENEAGHRNPIPTCVTLGGLILPSVISGRAGIPNDAALSPEEEVERAFQRMKTVVEAAGGSLNGIGKVTVYLKDFTHRDLVNKSWLKMFPEENNRPARHVIPLDLPGKAIIQLDVIATV